MYNILCVAQEQTSSFNLVEMVFVRVRPFTSIRLDFVVNEIPKSLSV